MKKKILYLILMLFAVSMPLGVSAQIGLTAAQIGSGSSIGYPQNPGGGGASSDGDFTQKNTYTVTNSWGARVTLVNKYGTRLAPSVNFFNTTFNKYFNHVFMFNGNYDKIEVINNGVSLKNKYYSNIGGTDIPGYKNITLYNTVTVSDILEKVGSEPNKIEALARKIAQYADSGTETDIVILDDFINSIFGKRFTTDSSAVDWYLLIEPIMCISKDGIYNEGGKTAYICGTTSEFSKYAVDNSYKAPAPFSEYQIHYNATWNWLYIASTGDGDYASFNANDNSSTFEGLTIGTGFTSSYIDKQAPAIAKLNGDGVGLIWLGKNAKPKESQPTCSSVTIDSEVSVSAVSGSMLVSVSGLYPSQYKGYYKKNVGYDPDYYINAVCYSAPTATTCEKAATNASKFPLSNGGLSIALESTYDKNRYTGYYNPNAGYDSRYYVNSVCYSAPTTTTCSSVVTNSSYPPNYGDKEIKLESNYNKSNYSGGYYNPNAKYDSRYYVNSVCYSKPACSDFYYSTKTFNKVNIDAVTQKNCCLEYEQKYKGNTTELNRLYRDHPECYSCSYTELANTPTCSISNNVGTVGDSFTSVNKNGAGDTQTCAYYVASGKVNSTSSNLVTRRTINPYCKVVCTEEVNIKFPLLNQYYFQQGSYIVWPTNLVFKDESSRLVLHGTANCWYYVDSVGLDILSKTNSSEANNYLKQCASDFKQVYDGSKNVVNYNLKGNFFVKYNDSEYGKSVSLKKESDESVNYGRNNNLNSSQISTVNTTANSNSYRRNNLNNFVRLVESITFNVTQTANYVIDPSSGYNYSYKGKYYSTYDEKWGNNSIKLDQASLGLKNDLYKGGKLEIDYGYIGGGDKVYSATSKTYGTCEYCTVSAALKECPTGTKNVGMNLTQIMEMENLSHEEAIVKYCDASLTVCPDGTYYAGSAVTEECLKDGVCKELTCNLHACTTNDECKVLNSCISDQIEKHGKSFESAKLYCENAYCGPGEKISDSIEYRVIDLKNPFPGVSAKFGVSIFNTNVAGRKPGQNWNSLNLVKKEILNNRGVSGDNIYSLQPLFEFNLTPSVIKEIRKYNDKNAYDDFTLRCTFNDKEACVAKGFNIRSEKYGNVKTLSACQNINNLNNFNSCYNS